MAECICDPRHLDVGGYDHDCPIHSREEADAPAAQSA